MAEELRGRALIESRFGELGCGKRSLVLGGSEIALAELLTRMGLLFDDAKPIDVQTLAPGHHVARYFDAQDQRIVAQEFDDSLQLIAETRAHIAEWIGEDAYFSEYSGH
jgi:hypothetical protein